jgi:DNA-binding XRE family transcriptional regulator
VSSLKRTAQLVDSDVLVKEFLKLVSALKSDQKLTHEQLSELAKVHRTTIGLLERQERVPSLFVANQIATALGYPLSELLVRAESAAKGDHPLSEKNPGSVGFPKNRNVIRANLRNEAAFSKFTGLDSGCLVEAIESCYHTLDTIDEQLLSKKSPVIEELVELANLSSMLGNLLGAGLAESSNGLYKRNKPHHYPDLVPLKKPAIDLELKMALETNKPKGHLPKPGNFITFRYVLGNHDGSYTRGKDSRGKTVWVWEVKVGKILESDYSISNTAGDSGKTAVIKTEVFKNMPLVYFDPKYSPHPVKAGAEYPGFN